MISAADAAKLLAAIVAGIEIADASPINLSDTDEIVFATEDNADPAADPNPVIAVAGADNAFAVVATGPPAAPAVAAAAPHVPTAQPSRTVVAAAQPVASGRWSKGSNKLCVTTEMEGCGDGNGQLKLKSFMLVLLGSRDGSHQPRQSSEQAICERA